MDPNLDKGRHGTNYTARAIMNYVGLGANVVEENTSFNTYRDEAGVQLDGRTGPYELTFASAPPVNFFWSVTLYLADTGHVFANALTGTASVAQHPRLVPVGG